jgi:hypothetical protein
MRDVLIGLLTFAASLGAYANDTVAALGVGGVIAYGKTDAVVMRKEVLEISPRRIEVAYEFVNETKSPVTLTVAFPLPPLSRSAAISRVQRPTFRVLSCHRWTGASVLNIDSGSHSRSAGRSRCRCDGLP